MSMSRCRYALLTSAVFVLKELSKSDAIKKHRSLSAQIFRFTILEAFYDEKKQVKKSNMAWKELNQFFSKFLKKWVLLIERSLVNASAVASFLKNDLNTVRTFEEVSRSLSSQTTVRWHFSLTFVATFVRHSSTITGPQGSSQTHVLHYTVNDDYTARWPDLDPRLAKWDPNGTNPEIFLKNSRNCPMRSQSDPLWVQIWSPC